MKYQWNISEILVKYQWNVSERSLNDLQYISRLLLCLQAGLQQLRSPPELRCTSLNFTTFYCISLQCTLLHCTTPLKKSTIITALYGTLLHLSSLDYPSLHFIEVYCPLLHSTACHCTFMHSTIFPLNSLLFSSLSCTLPPSSSLYFTAIYVTAIYRIIHHLILNSMYFTSLSCTLHNYTALHCTSLYFQ